MVIRSFESIKFMLLRSRKALKGSVQARKEADDKQEAEAQPDLLARLVLHH